MDMTEEEFEELIDNFMAEDASEENREKVSEIISGIIDETGDEIKNFLNHPATKTDAEFGEVIHDGFLKGLDLIGSNLHTVLVIKAMLKDRFDVSDEVAFDFINTLITLKSLERRAQTPPRQNNQTADLIT